MESGYSSLGVELSGDELSEIAIKEKINRKIDKLAQSLSPQAMEIISERLRSKQVDFINKFEHSPDEALLEVEIAREIDQTLESMRGG